MGRAPWQSRFHPLGNVANSPPSAQTQTCWLLRQTKMTPVRKRYLEFICDCLHAAGSIIYHGDLQF